MNSTNKHILMADDDPDDVDLFKELANDQCPDLKITVADNGEKLLDLLKTMTLPDAILLDINMPLKDGKECLREIRSNNAFKHIPVVILSTNNNDTEIKSLLADGANHYFVKPTTYEGLKSIVTSVCNSNF